MTNPPIYKSLTFWTLLAGLAAFVAKFYFPAFPLDSEQILMAVLFLLGLIKVVPSVWVRGRLTPPIVSSLGFWQLLAGLLFFVLRYFFPTFPYTAQVLLGVILFVLGLFDIHPEFALWGRTR